MKGILWRFIYLFKGPVIFYFLLLNDGSKDRTSDGRLLGVQPLRVSGR